MDISSELGGDAVVAARRLLGCEIERTIDGHTVCVRIVETEAYDETDAASHSYNGRTPRTNVMFGPAGYLYVYFTYGMHYCANLVVGPEGYGAAVLIRAVEPIHGEAWMQARRPVAGVNLSNGPAKWCQALGIDRTLNGHDMTQKPLRLSMTVPLEPAMIVTSARIGISKSRDEPWRFYIKDNPYVSKV